MRAQPITVPLHVTARGVRRLAIFRDEEDYEGYVGLLGAASRRFDWRILGFSLLPNHVHVLLRLSSPNLSLGMKWLHCLYAKRFNRRNGFIGHAFDSRFASRPIESEEHLFRALRYVALNPVTAGLCRDPGDWRWSSFAGTAAEGDEYPFVSSDGVRAMYGSSAVDGARGFAEAVRLRLDDDLVI